ncbi:nucleoside deaminase [Rhodoplanes sp. TEM]|uniref:Nucleoside deaminase n=1 Tax=Rhodoplanes tepidamans TaxID=200616 RepID=A0ABT5J8Y7_RHOTP|nr:MULTISPECIES: nucleoside deaminase [Rhodoplanes]MDC7785932.1 nucleoside deaminase [Rhodoplanes tepidamans]MDC7986256.1 nucleoside deaminase [Rhodoplanes sp. TEM]MDQ0355449.1 tRNA(Arg) A34 adenosine deaminase TadA [Rhodoplanes tepidamans]
MDELDFMRRAIALSRDSVATGGGPFGAVVVRDGVIVGEGANRVVPDGDPTAHAEVVAIRDACRRLGTHVLDGAVVYTSCEPCPMCLSAIWWARVKEIVYANDRAGAAAIGFDDHALYEEVARPLEARVLPLRRLAAEEAAEVFRAWEAKDDKVRY